MRETVIAGIEREKVIAIVRGAGAEACRKVADALYQGGIRLMEVTFPSRQPPEQLPKSPKPMRAVCWWGRAPSPRRSWWI